MEPIGMRIKRLRGYLGLTQKDFGERIGVKGNTVTGYESGNRNVSNQTFELICREFNVNEQWLRDGTGEMLKPKPSDELAALAEKYHLNDFEFSVIQKYVAMPDDFRQAVTDFMVDVIEDVNHSHREELPEDGKSDEELRDLIRREVRSRKSLDEESV